MLQFITDNWTGIAAALLAAHGLALAIVNLTPTPKDNEILAKVYKGIEWAAGFFTKKSKDTGEAK
jgi:hypothetical protein